MTPTMVFLICAVVLFFMIPWEIWKGLLYVGIILLVGFIGFTALMMVLVGL